MKKLINESNSNQFALVKLNQVNPSRFFILGVATLMLSASFAFSADRGSVLFYSPFDGDAQAVSNTSGQPVEKEGRLLEFAPGQRGQAVQVGENLAQISYEVDGNLPSEKGTIEMWICPENWEGSDNAQHVFFQAGGRGELMIYKHRVPGHGNFIIGSDGTPETRDAVIQKINSWQRGEWHQVVVTWDQNEAKFYVDGLASGTLTNPPVPQNLAGLFEVGDLVTDGSGETRTLIDELYIYGRALSEAEVAWTFEHGKDRPAGLDVPAN